jgi:hypothetical protein
MSRSITDWVLDVSYHFPGFLLNKLTLSWYLFSLLALGDWEWDSWSKGRVTHLEALHL